MNKIQRSSARTSFRETMEEATASMPVHQRAFSRLIHTGLLSVPIELIGRLVFRPNPLLVGAVLSFGFTLTSYLLAKNLGYSLSGFESLGAFIIGWLLGLLYDFFRTATTDKN
jgi:hypothetical protein